MQLCCECKKNPRHKTYHRCLACLRKVKNEQSKAYYAKMKPQEYKGQPLSWYDTHPPIPEPTRAQLDAEQLQIDRNLRQKEAQELQRWLSPCRTLDREEIEAIAGEIVPVDQINYDRHFVLTVN